VVLLHVVAVVNCRQLDGEAFERLPSTRLGGQLLVEPPRPGAGTGALAVARRRRQYTGGAHLPADDKRSWRQNRVRVWGKRNTHNVDDDDDDGVDKRSWRKNTVRVWGKQFFQLPAE